MQHTRPYHFTPELADELARHGWRAFPDGGLNYIDGGPHPKYPLITLRKFCTETYEESSRAVLEVNGDSCYSVKSKVHVVDLKRPLWKRTLQRWFGAAVMGLINEHDKIRQLRENQLRNAAKDRQAIQQIHPCSDRVAETLRMRCNIRQTESGLSLHAHLMHRYETFQDPQAIALFIQLVNHIESKDPNSLVDL